MSRDRSSFEVVTLAVIFELSPARATLPRARTSAACCASLASKARSVSTPSTLAESESGALGASAGTSRVTVTGSSWAMSKVAASRSPVSFTSAAAPDPPMAPSKPATIRRSAAGESA